MITPRLASTIRHAPPNPSNSQRISDDVRIGVTAAVVGFREVVDRGHVIGQADDYLVARVRAGDDAAFERIYDRYARGMFAFCVHMLGSREAAESLPLTIPPVVAFLKIASPSAAPSSADDRPRSLRRD